MYPTQRESAGAHSWQNTGNRFKVVTMTAENSDKEDGSNNDSNVGGHGVGSSSCSDSSSNSSTHSVSME